MLNLLAAAAVDPGVESVITGFESLWEIIKVVVVAVFIFYAAYSMVRDWLEERRMADFWRDKGAD